MELKEAYDIIDATIGMFHSIMYEIDNGKLKEDFLLTPVYSCVDTIADEHLNFELQSKEYYIYKDGDKEHKRYIVNIAPVCNYMVNEWPSPKAMKINKLLKSALHECLDSCKETFGEYLNVPFEEGYIYDKLYSISPQDTRIIENVMIDTIHEMAQALRLTEYAELDEDEDNKKEDYAFFDPDTEPLLQEIAELKAEINKLVREKKELENKKGVLRAENKKHFAEIQSSNKSYEQAFNGKGLPCFTSAQMGILLFAVGQLTEDKPPGKTTLGDIVEKIGGYKATTAKQNLKGEFKEKDKEFVANAIEKHFPKLAAKVRKL